MGPDPSFQLLRTVDPAALDTDPITTQPGDGLETAQVRGGAPRFVVWEVDADSRVVAPSGTVDVGLVILRTLPGPGAGFPPQDVWSRGPINTGVTPGEEQIQAQAPDTTRFSVVITAQSGSPPAGHKYAIYAGPAR